MSMHTKHRQNITWCHVHNRDYFGPIDCCDCSRRLGRSDSLCVIETQVNIFRGDDEVEFLCEACAKQRGIETPDEKRRKSAQKEISAIRKNIAKPGGDTPGRKKRLMELVATHGDKP